MVLDSPKLADLAEQETGEILKRARAMMRDLKRKNFKLKQDVKLLTNNNKAMEKLIEILEERVKKLTEDMNKRYVYSYEDGGWIEKGSLKKRKVRIGSYKNIKLDSINSQLEEILRLIKRHKKNLNKESIIL